MADYTPTLFRKGALERNVETWGDHYQALWDGYFPDGSLPPESTFSPAQRAEIAALRNVVVSSADPGLTEPGLWVQDLGDGNFTIWIEDGQ